ncbi:MAG: putative acetyltransferase [Spirochaetes bacterium]|nr:MAG: putative acetyltransferase [Spirochaetota bacterium]
MDFTLRPLGTEDAESMWNLINEVKDEEKYLFHTLRFPKEGTARYIEAHNAAGNPVIGAFDAYGRLAGWADMNRGGFEEIAHTASLGMGVAKPFRGMGLGSLLLKACIDSARRQGIEKIELEVFASNAAARALYEKMGFVFEGCLKARRKFKGVYEDMICMGLFL